MRMRRILLAAALLLAATPAPAQKVIEMPLGPRIGPGTAKPSKTQADDPLARVVWFGRGAVLLQHDRTVYVNPYGLPESYRDGDLVLLTDARPEHCSPKDVERVLKPDGVVLAPPDCAERLGLGPRAETPKPGERLVRRGLEIETVPAYKGEKSGVPKEKAWLGFVVDSRGRRFYFVGPAGLIPEIQGRRPDAAFLSVGGTDGVEPSVAAAMAEAIGARLSVPVDWDASSDGRRAADAFAAAVGEKARVLAKGR